MARKRVPYEETKDDPRFRPSYAIGLNPRSETYVRRGTAPGRYAATYGGNVAGGLIAPGIGQGVGATAGRNYNIQTDKVRAYRRRDKAQAKGWGGIAADAGGYYYGRVEKTTNGPFGVEVATGIKKSIPVALAAKHGPGLTLHGAPSAAAKQISRGYIKESPSGNLGPGVYTTNDMKAANSFGSGESIGSTNTNPLRPAARSKKLGKVFGFKPTGTRAEAPLWDENFFERTHSVADLGKPVHSQNVNRTSLQRGLQRQQGKPALPKTGFRLPMPTPVSQLDREGLAARKMKLRRFRPANTGLV